MSTQLLNFLPPQGIILLLLNKKNGKEIQKIGEKLEGYKIKKPCQQLLDRDKTKNKHYEQTLSLIKSFL